MPKELHIGFVGHISKSTQTVNGEQLFLYEERMIRVRKFIESYLVNQLNHYQYIWCHTRADKGVDAVMSMAVQNIKLQHPNRIFIHAHIPHKEYAKAWRNQTETYLWFDHVSRADKVSEYTKNTSLTSEETDELKEVKDTRNMQLVDHVTTVLAVYDYTPHGSQMGGLRRVMEYAYRQKKQVVPVQPRKLYI